jgi:hypothetical protein
VNRFLAAAIALVIVVSAHDASAAAPVVKDLSFPGGTERTLLLTPDRPPNQPKATVILFPGGDGIIGLAPDGAIATLSNFLVHFRNQWVERGYAVLLPDVPAGVSNLMGRRLGDSYAAAVAALVDYARQMNPVPVWLVGTSQGTNAVVNAASRMTHGEIAGIILTSSLTRPGKAAELKETVFDANLAAINVPALIVSHADDACILSPAGDSGRLQAALSGSPRAKAILVTGGKPAAADTCGADAPHGFYGVEAETIAHMASFIAAH